MSRLPPDQDYPTVRAFYFVGNGSWGPVPGLALVCRTCRVLVTETAAGHPGDDKPPEVERTKVRLRRACPRGQEKCQV